MLTLGIPASGTMALMLGALMIHGITPGPAVMTEKPDLFWGLIASTWVGNLRLVVLNLPLVGLWVSLLRVPYRMLFPAIMVFSAVGIIYRSSNVSFDIYLTAIFGILLGIAWRVLECSPVPMLLGFVLGCGVGSWRFPRRSPGPADYVGVRPDPGTVPPPCSWPFSCWLRSRASRPRA